METDRRSLLMSAAHGLRRVWWYVRRPIAIGAAGLVIDADGRVLLVRQSYAGRRWTLPGGGIKRGETMLECALREIEEEAGVTATAPDNVTLLGVYANFTQGKSDHLAVYVVRDFEQRPTNDLEIANTGFFAPDALPEPVSGATLRRIDEYLGKRAVSVRW
ncbi:MAG TPA: NUDIX domain-containing protein [Acidimicrobiales bacterium]|nr:NUDIX domain-containing protein [Acidimicrobiales bacterium]